MAKQRRIGIYGGTFDPIHMGHLIAAEQARIHFALDEVRFLPNGKPPHKIGPCATKAQRVEMLRRAIVPNPYFSMDLREVESKRPSYSYETMHTMRAENPDEHLFFLMGEDSLLEIESWYRWQDLLQCVEPVVLCRPQSAGQKPKGNLQEKIAVLRAQGFTVHALTRYPVQISSSEIRSDLRQGKSVRYLVPDAVFSYIQEEGIYV